MQWKVLLIGGNSATGKSYLARQLSKYFDATLTEVDDIRIALQQKLKLADHPDLFFFVKHKNFLRDFPVDQLVSKLLAVGDEIWPSLNALIDKHIVCDESIIFEGDGIIPRLLANKNQDKIKSIFLYDDRENIKKKELNRKRGGDNLNLEKQIEFSYQFGQEIRQQAKNCGFITISASPAESLLKRVMSLF